VQNAFTNRHDLSSLAVAGGLCGIVGTLCYVAGAFLPLPDRVGYGVVMLWPVLSVIFAFALYRVIAAERDGPWNQLAFVFACLAFATVAAMISVQLAVRLGMAEVVATAPSSDVAFGTLRRGLRLVDMGLDVAWDVLVGTSLVLLGGALRRDSRYGKAWGAAAGLLGVVLVALNVATFPWPPATRGLVDVGPLVGLLVVAVGVRLMTLGLRGRA